MAQVVLPSVSVLADWAFPQSIVSSLVNELQEPLSSGLLTKPLEWAQRVDPNVSALALVVVWTLVTYMLSVLTGNCSWVDRLWSLLPIYYAAHYAFVVPALHSGVVVHLGRVQVLTLLLALWGVRLTYNFARKGGYALASEDHRWPELRALVTGAPWELFKFFFIAFYQNVLLFLFSGAPAYAAYVSNTPFNGYDALLTALFLLLLLGETIADEQQWRFQTAKYSKPRPADPTGEMRDGFLQSGLFRYSRHPNFFCEISMWWAIYGFSGLCAVSASGIWLNWTVVGTVLLTLLFQGSTTFTEYITAKKYPKYHDYCSTTSRLIPWFSSAAPLKSAAAPTRGRRRAPSTTPKRK